MKTLDYESILCTAFSCNRFSIPLEPSVKEKVIEAMAETIKVVKEDYDKEIDRMNDLIEKLEDDL